MTANQRASIVGLSSLSRVVYPAPGSTQNADWRVQTAAAYASGADAPRRVTDFAFLAIPTGGFLADTQRTGFLAEPGIRSFLAD